MFNNIRQIFLVGIKGVAMANIAIMLKKIGKKVVGADVDKKFITDDLLKQFNINYQASFNPRILPRGTDLVIYSAAHAGSSNPVVVEAKKSGIQTTHQAAFLGKFLAEFKTKIAVCGCHGKTTTSSLLAYALSKLGTKPSYLVGAPFFSNYPGADYQDKKFFVIEADEYGVEPPKDKTPKFNFLNPDYIVCTNIDFDHPDVYQNLKQTQEAFLNFFDQRKLILCSDDEPTVQLINRLNRKQYETFGFARKADLTIAQDQIIEGRTFFKLNYKKEDIGIFSISLFGKKNVSNAAAVVLILLKLGLPLNQIREAIADFTGPKRRFELLYQTGSTYLFDDYGHHPAEITATIQAVRTRFPGKRLIVIFQPHTYSRTKIFQKEFVAALSLADMSFVTPIFASAREKEISPKEQLNLDFHNYRKILFTRDVLQQLRSKLMAGDVILTMGAGDIYELKDDIIKIINKL